MEIPAYQPFYLDDLDALRVEIARLGLELPVDEDLGPLAARLAIGSREAGNRFCVQPMSGNDAEDDGAPGDLTRRRYLRFARGGAAVIWIESMTAGPVPARPGCLALHPGTLSEFRSLARGMREAAAERGEGELIIILQLAPALPRGSRVHGQVESGDQSDASLLSDAKIMEAQSALVASAALAAEAGFDGVDVQACRGALPGALLGAHTRGGEYGGSFENRSRLLVESLAAIRSACPELLLATRLCAYDARQATYGFGVDREDYRRLDLDEPKRLVRLLRDTGLDLLNSTVPSPNLTAEDRASRPRPDGEFPDEHPLMTLDRQLQIAGTLRDTADGIPVVGSGFSWLRGFLPQVAAGAIAGGTIDLVGLGRTALADPDAPSDVLERGGMDRPKTCMVCFACNQLRDGRSPVGCPIHDADTYGAAPAPPRRLSPNELPAEAARCHLCESAPCTAASRTGTDIPAFIRAFRDGDSARAYEIIRERDPLPELTAQLTPGWLHSEGACVEAALSGRPIGILDLQFNIAWEARQNGATGVPIPPDGSGKKIAIVGGGPSGIAAAIDLLERGHEVDLFEASQTLGGTPARVIPAGRLRKPMEEIEAIMAPALEARRLRTHFGVSLGAELHLDELRAGWDATLLAAGVWREESLRSTPCTGVLDALSFLESAKRGEELSVPPRVALLAGGDCAMDAALTLKELGADKLFIVYGDPRAEMHWHMSEDWFATPGVELMTCCRPLDYVQSEGGELSGLRVHHTDLDEESVLEVEMVVEAMGLRIAPSLHSELGGLPFDENDKLLLPNDGFRIGADGVYAAGGLINGGASVARCVAEGRAAAQQIHAELR